MARGITVIQPVRSLNCPRRDSVAACRSPTQRRHLRPCAHSASGCRCHARPSSDGLRNASLPGRFQRITAAGGFEWVLDVAHNPDSARVLAANLARYRVPGRTIAVCGMLADKDVESVVDILRERVDEWIAAATDGPRALDDAALAARAGARGVDMALGGTVPDALDRAAAVAARGDRVVVFGSFHTVGPALEHLGLAWAHGDRSALCV